MSMNSNRRGQGMTEILVTVVLVAIVVLLAVQSFGFRVEEGYGRAAVETRFELETDGGNQP